MLTSIREVVESHRGMAKSGSSPYKNYGLGAMTFAQRDWLLKAKKIMTQDGIDLIATRPCGMVEYSPRGSEMVKRFEFKGFDISLIQFKVAEAEGIVKNNHDKLIFSGVVDLPAWDGTMPTL